MKLVKEKAYPPKQVAVEIIKQKKHVPFFPILICLKSNIDSIELNPTFISLLALNERCLILIANQIAKNITLEKMPDFKHELTFYLNDNTLLKSQQEIKKELDLCYHQKFDDALIFSKEIVKLNNSKFLLTPLSPESVVAEISKEQIFSFMDSLKISVEMSKTNYCLKSLMPIIETLLLITSKHCDQDIKLIVKNNSKILEETSKIANFMTKKTRNNLRFKKSFSLNIEIANHQEQTSNQANQIRNYVDENAKTPNPQTATRRLRKEKIGRAIALLSRKKHR
jgi:hypothetical protein